MTLTIRTRAIPLNPQTTKAKAKSGFIRFIIPLFPLFSTAFLFAAPTPPYPTGNRVTDENFKILYTSPSINGSLDMNSNKITELTNGSSAQDAAAFGQIPLVATQAEQETGTATTAWAAPGVQQYHNSASKAWVIFRGTGTVAALASYNVSSITDDGTGVYTVNFTNSFSSVNYACVCTPRNTSGTRRFCTQSSVDATVSAFGIGVAGESFSGADSERIHVACFGDQ